MGIKQKITAIKERAKRYFLVNRATMSWNFLMAAVKIGMGLFTLSFFVVLNGLYSVAVGASKAVYIRGRKVSRGNVGKERRYYLIICGILFLASVAYILYMLRLFFQPETRQFSKIFGIAVAAVSFTELIVAIIGLSCANKRRDLLMNGIKCVSLASAFTAIVFTQVALLAFAANDDMSYYNAIAGICFGAACVLICVYMLINYFVRGREIGVAAEEEISPLAGQIETGGDTPALNLPAAACETTQGKSKPPSAAPTKGAPPEKEYGKEREGGDGAAT